MMKLIGAAALLAVGSTQVSAQVCNQRVSLLLHPSAASMPSTCLTACLTVNILWRGRRTDGAPSQDVEIATCPRDPATDNRDPACDQDLDANSYSADCMTCMFDGGGENMLTCLGAAMPAAPFCPAANPFDSTATVRETGECGHACMAQDAWQTTLCLSGGVGGVALDFNQNTTCGIGSCDRHTTEAACAAGDGHWQADQFSVKGCPDVQLFANYMTGSYPDRAAAMVSYVLVSAGEDCCTGFTTAGYAVCSYADRSDFVAVSSASDEDRGPLMAAFDQGCLMCLMGNDGDLDACIAANPNPGTPPPAACTAADVDGMVR